MINKLKIGFIEFINSKAVSCLICKGLTLDTKINFFQFSILLNVEISLPIFILMFHFFSQVIIF